MDLKREILNRDVAKISQLCFNESEDDKKAIGGRIVNEYTCICLCELLEDSSVPLKERRVFVLNVTDEIEAEVVSSLRLIESNYGMVHTDNTEFTPDSYANLMSFKSCEIDYFSDIVKKGTSSDFFVKLTNGSLAGSEFVLAKVDIAFCVDDSSFIYSINHLRVAGTGTRESGFIANALAKGVKVILVSDSYFSFDCEALVSVDATANGKEVMVLLRDDTYECIDCDEELLSRICEVDSSGNSVGCVDKDTKELPLGAFYKVKGYNGLFKVMDVYAVAGYASIDAILLSCND